MKALTCPCTLYSKVLHSSTIHFEPHSQFQTVKEKANIITWTHNKNYKKWKMVTISVIKPTIPASQYVDTKSDLCELEDPVSQQQRYAVG